MTDKAEFLRLAERVEAASGPDRELDARIRCAAFAPPEAYVEQSLINGAWVTYHGLDTRGRPRVFEHWPSHEARVGEFTASLDAAMSLIEGVAFLIILSEIKGDGMPHCVVGNPESCELFEATADTMPLALCAAALRALAAQQGEG